MDPFEAALADLKSQETPLFRETARIHGVDHTTLSRHYNGISRPRAAIRDEQALLTKQQEKDLVAYINKLCLRGTPPTNPMVKRFAAELASRPPGKCWVYRFVKRWSNTLDSGFLDGIDSSRQKADNYTSLSRYFQMVCGPTLFWMKLIYIDSYKNH